MHVCALFSNSKRFSFKTLRSTRGNHTSCLPNTSFSFGSSPSATADAEYKGRNNSIGVYNRSGSGPFPQGFVPFWPDVAKACLLSLFEGRKGRRRHKCLWLCPAAFTQCPAPAHWYLLSAGTSACLHSSNPYQNLSNFMIKTVSIQDVVLQPPRTAHSQQPRS